MYMTMRQTASLRRNLTMIPGLYKLFDEGAVNCRDHQVRQAARHLKNVSRIHFQVKHIDFDITPEDAYVLPCYNDGNGIDVAEHPEHKLWIPEMIFGHLRTSTNYDKTQKKIVGGKNGFGFKLVLIWSILGASGNG